MTTDLEPEIETDRVVAAAARGVPWWLFLGTGLLWIVIAMGLLSFKPSAATTIAYLVGMVLILAGVNELVQVAVGEAWRWAHGLLGAIFLASGFSAFANPFQTFGALALLIGWYLIIKGTFDVTISIAAREQIPLWGLLLASGLFEIALGAWALGYPGRSAWLLVVWVGLGALMRGITEIVLAFQIRHLAHSA